MPEERLQEKWRDYLQQITLPAQLCLQNTEVLVQEKYRESQLFKPTREATGRAYLVFFSNPQKPSLEGKEDWPPPSATWLWKLDVKSSPFLLNRDIFRSQSQVSWLSYVFILLTGWHLAPHISSPLANLPPKGVISSSKEWGPVQPAWREAMENRVLADRSSRTRVTSW